MRGIEQLRHDALEIFKAAIEAADPRRAVKSAIACDGGTIQIEGKPIGFVPRRVRAIAFGKAACAMAEGLRDAIPSSMLIEPGIVVAARGTAREVAGFRVLEAGHPLPDADGERAALSVERFVAGGREDDLLLVLISGGGSAVLPAPVPDITLADKMATTKLLLHAGANIRELNTVRKHLSRLKGGWLAKLAAPARVRALILSDVVDDTLRPPERHKTESCVRLDEKALVGDVLPIIASGPLVPDPTTYADALAVIDRLGVRDRLPQSAREHLEAGTHGERPETPKPGDSLFRDTTCHVVGHNVNSQLAAALHANQLGYAGSPFLFPITGEARTVGVRFVQFALRTLRHWEELPQAQRPPALAVVGGGETTVTVRGKGKGGRNQEMALAFALGAATFPETGAWVFLSAGTDGIDGPTDAAGGLVDAESLARMRAKGIDPVKTLDDNDSNTALAASGDLVITGPTGTNVADIQVLLLERNG